jgi:hypothetical protein
MSKTAGLDLTYTVKSSSSRTLIPSQSLQSILTIFPLFPDKRPDRIRLEAFFIFSTPPIRERLRYPAG